MGEVEVKNKNRNIKVNEKQKKMMVEYLKKEPELLSGKFSSTFTFKDATVKWTKLAELLNSIPGASKSWKEWRKTWQDLRSKTKQKASSNKRNMNKTGGGPLIHDILTTTEEDIVDIIKPVSIDGHQNVRESLVKINILDEVDINNDDFLIHGITGKDQAYNDVTPEKSNNNAARASHKEISAQQDKNNEPQNDVNTPTPVKSNNNTVNHKKFPTKKKLQHTAAAETAYAKMLQKKLDIKQNYYDKKLELLQEMLQSQKNSATALEQCAAALNRTAIALEELV